VRFRDGRSTRHPSPRRAPGRPGTAAPLPVRSPPRVACARPCEVPSHSSLPSVPPSPRQPRRSTLCRVLRGMIAVCEAKCKLPLSICLLRSGTALPDSAYRLPFIVYHLLRLAGWAPVGAAAREAHLVDRIRAAGQAGLTLPVVDAQVLQIAAGVAEGVAKSL